MYKFYNVFRATQDDASASNGNKDPLSFDGMADAEVEKRLKVVKILMLQVDTCLLMYIYMEVCEFW